MAGPIGRSRRSSTGFAAVKSSMIVPVRDMLSGDEEGLRLQCPGDIKLETVQHELNSSKVYLRCVQIDSSLEIVVSQKTVGYGDVVSKSEAV